MLKTPETRMTAARTRLLLDFPWFGSLAMRLRIEPSEEFPTLATDGTTLKYNPDFLRNVSDSELTGILGHEVMHCALLHPFRRGNRDVKLWNQACDYAINSELLKSGLTLPQDALVDHQYDGLSADVIYAKLSQNPPSPDNQSGDDSQDSGEPSTGTVQDAPKDSGEPSDGKPERMSESDWKVAAEQASDVARMAGKLGAGLDRQVKQSRESREDWRAILREFIEHTVPSDYSWLSPNRRFISDGIYLPGMIRENTGRIALAIDTSGSITDKLLGIFGAEIASIQSESKPEKITVVYCDSKVNRVDEFATDDTVELKHVGGGGTCFNPVFEHFKASGDLPSALVYFTDLDCYDVPQEPEYPVLWVTPLSITRSGLFGRTIRISEEL